METNMNYRIEEKEAFRIVGVLKPLRNGMEKNFAVILGLWQTAAEDGTIKKIAPMMDSKPKGLLGVSICRKEKDWVYFIGVATDAKRKDERLEEYTVPASAWAVFKGAGEILSIQELERQILREWLPASGYEYTYGPVIEVYLTHDPVHARFEVWLPVKRRGEKP